MKLKKFLSLLLSAAMAFTLLTATAFAAAPAEEENGFLDFLFGEKYTYLYAALTWDEYWANEDVYAAGSTESSDMVDSRGEYDKGAFDVVSRATANHGLHRGSFQCDAMIYAQDGRKPLETLPEVFRFQEDEDRNAEMIQEIEFTEKGCICEWRKIRPIPEDDSWFEKVWRDYREDKYYKR